MSHRFPYAWKRTDLERVRKHGHSVFSCFACGGGSSFGYKMAGYDVIGCNEIDKEMIAFYKANHHPKYPFLEPIQEFKNRTDIPEALYNLDILDGSPPCSTFSMAGDREKGWGKNKKFREGQAEQVLSDLFFEYLDLVGKLKPKIAVAENVQGMLTGKAKGYCKLIFDKFRALGYDPQLFLLNSASMGVPQVRERVFFIARRIDLGMPILKMEFNEPAIPFGEVVAKLPFQDLVGCKPNEVDRAYWHRCRPGDSYSSVSGGSYFSWCRLSMDKVSPTVLATENMKHPDEMRNLSWPEICLIGSYPYDYDFLSVARNKRVYCVGMSVPPVMMAQIAAQIAEQCFGVSADQIDEAWRIE
jgi:DNA (cytosine-5)-methyltransferase 1